MITISTITVNNIKFDNSLIEVPLDNVVINWQIVSQFAALQQEAFELQIGTSNINWGSASFIPNIQDTKFISDKAQSYSLLSRFVNRGTRYYGQIRIRDNSGRVSEYYRFSFSINILPYIIASAINPSDGSIDQDLTLTYSASSDVKSVAIKWYKNGRHYTLFDNYTKIAKQNLYYNDSWYAELVPYDGIENGPINTVKAITLKKAIPYLQSVQIIPLYPKVDDILEANFAIIDGQTDRLVNKTVDRIDWYVNDQIVEAARDSRFVRLDLRPQDRVYYIATPFDGISLGESVRSRTVTVQDNDFIVSNLLIEGEYNNIRVKSINPSITWDEIAPYNRQSKYAKILIGTAQGANNVHEVIIDSANRKYTIPNNIIKVGIDYFLSVSVSDVSDQFINYSTAKFRVEGALWENSVSNQVGWTIELSCAIKDFQENENPSEVAANAYQYFQFIISDGAKTVTMQLYKDKIIALFGPDLSKEYKHDNTFFTNFLVVGKSSDVQIFVNNSLAIDAIGIYNQTTSDKSLIFGSNSYANVSAYLKRILYTTEGYFVPGDAAYAKVSLEKIYEFTGMSVADLHEVDGNIVICTNPLNANNSGNLYKLYETRSPRRFATENVDRKDFYFNDFSQSPNKNTLQISHTAGTTSFVNYFIPKYDIASNFATGANPSENYWELVSTTNFEATSYTDDGLIIDTTIGERQQAVTEDTREIFVSQDTEALSFISLYDTIISYDFDISIEDTTLTIYVHNQSSVLYVTSLQNKNLNELIDEINSLDGTEYNYFALYYSVYLNNSSIGSQAATRLQKTSRTHLFPSVTINGNYEISDSYIQNPYGTYATGKWYYTHRKKGTPWFERVDNQKGWTVDLSMRIDVIQDSSTPSDIDKIKGVGLYVNDGMIYENFYFMPQEIMLEQNGKSIVYDTTDLTDYRITCKEEKIKLFAKRQNEQQYVMLKEFEAKGVASNRGNSSKPDIFFDSLNNMHAVWHDDGAGTNKRQLYYSFYDSSQSSWSDPEVVFKDSFSSNNPKIAVDSDGLIYIVFETTKADYTDIAVITKNENGWSKPFLLSSGIYDSFNPQIVIDEYRSVFVVWEDYRNVQPQIYFAKRNGYNGQWYSEINGNAAVQVTREEIGAQRPSIYLYNNIVYMSYTVFNTRGFSSIKVLRYYIGKNQWENSQIGGSEFEISGINSFRCDKSTICVDLKGYIYVFWQEFINNNSQIFGRRLNQQFAFATGVLQLTQGPIDSINPKSGLDLLTGDVYVVFEKKQDLVFSEYDPYINSIPTNSNKKYPTVFLLKYDASNNVWFSSNAASNNFDVITAKSIPLRNFDVEFKFPLPRLCHTPTIAGKFSGNLHILFESTDTAREKAVINHTRTFTQIRDIVYNLDYVPIYQVVLSAVNIDPYGEGELRLDGVNPRKEIRFGDFSDNTSGRLLINKIRYYLSDAVAPFNVKLISTTTSNLPSTNVLTSAINNFGDIWIGTTDGLVYYNNIDKQVYDFVRNEYGIGRKKIRKISFDIKHNMYVIANNNLYVSFDHSYFYIIRGLVPKNPIDFAFDANSMYVVSDEGMFVYDLTKIYTLEQITFAQASEARIIYYYEYDDVVVINSTSGLPTDFLTCIVKDEANVLWIGSNAGLIRYFYGDIYVFTSANGLLSNYINKIAIRNTAIRFIATSAGVNKMLGVSISQLEFNFSNLQPAALIERQIGDIKIPKFANCRSIAWQNPNILYIGTTLNIYQITFIEQDFNTETVEISIYQPNDFAFRNIESQINDDLQNYRLVGAEDIAIPENCVYEVLLNGRKITQGFKFSAKDKFLRFDYPLFYTDTVEVNLRFDLEKIYDFTPNSAAQIVEGNKSVRLQKVVARNNYVYAVTTGDVKSLQINDDTTGLPFDKIVLDRKPPTGRIKFGNQIGSTIFNVLIDPYDPYNVDPYTGLAIFDAVSGIDRMIVSNFPNFTSDGETKQQAIAFTRSIVHDIGSVLSQASKDYTISSGKGNRIATFVYKNGRSFVFFGTSNTANVYVYNFVTQTYDIFQTIETTADIPNPNASIEFLQEYNGDLYCGTSNPAGAGRVYRLNQTTNKFELFRNLSNATHAYCAISYDNVLYIGCGGPNGVGSIVSYDGSFTNVFADNLSNAVYNMTVADSDLYAATGRDGRIYKIDIANKTQTIVDVNAEKDVLSIGSVTLSDQTFVYAGFANTGTIKKSITPDGTFELSFKTVAASVNAMKFINGFLYAAIANTLYKFDNVWTAVYVHSEEIRDMDAGGIDSIFFISDNYVYKLDTNITTKRIYLKLIDKAGNETSIYKDVATNTLETSLFAELSLTDLKNYFNNNMILRCDEFGKVTRIRTGTDEFYSADLIDEESGEYYSEIFNGTNNFVAWDTITWEASIPANTNMLLEVRAAKNKDDILLSPFSLKIDGAEKTADISFLNGQFIQFRITLRSRIKNLSPSVKYIVIKSVSSRSAHFFTTNFVLPSKIKSGILTSTKLLPVASDIIFGINTKNSTDFADYQLIDENRIFTMQDSQYQNNLRIGVRFISPSQYTPTDFTPEYNPYGADAALNSLEWRYTALEQIENPVNFVIKFYDDASLTNEMWVADSAVSRVGFSANQDIFPTNGIVMELNESVEISFVPTGDTALRCNQVYYASIYSNIDNQLELITEGVSYYQTCGTTYVDIISFDFKNTSITDETFHFRIRFYNDLERTDLKYTAFSGNDISNWYVDQSALGAYGVVMNAQQSVSIDYLPSLSNVDSDKIYYISVDVFDGQEFQNNSNSFTFRANSVDDKIYCGKISNVPVLKNMSLMFELENNEFINMKVDT